ncbi:LOW QUALITY PROTEIN: putative crossover junction endonuclease EME2 [Chlamydotis macqueenii]
MDGIARARGLPGDTRLRVQPGCWSGSVLGSDGDGAEASVEGDVSGLRTGEWRTIFEVPAEMVNGEVSNSVSNPASKHTRCLLKDPGADAWVKVLSSLDYSFEPQGIPCSVTWRRNVPSTLSTPDGPVVKNEEEGELVEPKDFLKSLFSLTQGFVNAPSASQPDLNQVLPWAGLEGSSTKTCSLVILGLDACGTCNQERGRRQALSPGRQSPSSQPGPELAATEEEILEALVVQLWGNIEEMFLETWQEFRQRISAKCPYKRQLESRESPFCTEGWAGAVREGKDGTGLWQAWKRQLQQFHGQPCTTAARAESLPKPPVAGEPSNSPGSC